MPDLEFKPTWAGTLQLLLTAMELGTPKGKELARAELERMAKAADAGAALADRVARLNPAAGEIGPGMLASLVEEARKLTNWKE